MPFVAFTGSDMSSCDSTDDSIRKVTDDFGRHRLTDVLEEENEDDVFSRPYDHIYNYRKRNSSFGSNASSTDRDNIWESHHLGMSDAGLNRNSDSSVVLTEDTDSFIIGQRVWVSGTKPGHIAFIGETKFAPGEWAGIALDEPIGKNDGSVGGTHYFQCEPKKGVFARLTRLTRVPLVQEGMGSGDTYVASTPSPVNNGVRRGPISPTGSTKSLLRSPVSMSGSNTSLTSSHVIDYKMGDRVIIKSSQGSKVGTVKYIGTTEFAPGEWVGVELDDPRGKNDGSVNGRRYFECRPNFGLFAPVSKVSKSPSRIKPGACVVHSGSGLPPSGMKRTNSKESMLSNISMVSGTSSIRRKLPTKPNTTPIPTRTALQDVLKEKQQHIEQLLKERDLERAEITRAASQADEAEQKLANLRQEYEKYRSECEVKLQEHMNLLNKLKEDRNELVTQLDDEKRKNEDLLFRLEEASIVKDDIEKKKLEQSVANEGNITKIKELEDQLKKEREKIDSLEADANKLFETEESLIKAKEEIETLKNQLQDARMKEISLEGDHVATSVLISSLQKEADQYKKDLEEKSELINVLKDEISKLNQNMKKQLEESANKRTDLETLCNNKENEISTLKVELEHVNKLAQDKIESLDKITTEKLNLETSLDKEIDRLKMELSAKVLDIETASENIKVKENEIKNLQAELDSVKNDLESKNKDLEQYQNNLTNTEATLKTELETLKEKLKQSTTENESMKKELSTQILEKDKKIEENNNTITVNFEEIKRLTNELENEKKKFIESNAELQEKFKKDIEEKDNQISQLATKLKEQKEELEKNLTIASQFESDYDIKSTELKKFKADYENIEKELRNNLNLKNEDLQKANDIIKQKEDEIQALQTQLQTTKIDLESVSTNLIQYQTNLSDVEKNLTNERDEIKEALKTKIVELEDTKKELFEIISKKDTQLEELKLVLTAKSEEVEKLLIEINNTKENQEKINKDILEKHFAEVGQWHEKFEKLETEVQKKNEEINSLHAKINQLEGNLKDRLSEVEVLRKELGDKNQQCVSEGEAVTKLNEQVKMLTGERDNFSLKITELEKIKVNLETTNKLLENDITAKDNELQVRIDINLEKEEQIKVLEVELKTTKDGLQKVTDELTKYQNNLNDVESSLKKEKDEIRLTLEAQTSEFEGHKKELLDKISQEEAKVVELTKIIADKSEQIEKMNNEIVNVKSNNEKDFNEITEKNKKEIEHLEIKISDLLTEIENKNTEVVKLSETVNKIKGNMKEKNVELDKLHEELEVAKKQHGEGTDYISKLNQQIKELETNNNRISSELTDSNKTISELILQKQKYEADIKTLNESSGNVDKKLEQLNKQLNEKENILETTKNEMAKKLQEVEKTVEDLQVTNKEVLDKIEKQKVEYEGKLIVASETEATLRDVIACSSKDSEKIKELQKSLETAKLNLDEKEKKLNIQNGEIIKLKEELSKTSTQQNGINATEDTSDPNSLLEEKLFAESQVEFLNSIIVDMQKKNEEQKARIEILEMGYSSSAADELASLGFKTDFKQPAPRMYCDICEEFDLHETEDCPTQAEDEPMPVHHHSGKETKEKPPPRPYCDLCGVFGHATEDCTEDQEF